MRETSAYMKVTRVRVRVRVSMLETSAYMKVTTN